MCDTFVALQNATRDHSVLFAKSADCEINEANALVRIPGRQHLKGETLRITHLVIPQAELTYEVILTKAFWTYGCEIGINEFGLAMGEEAVFTTEMTQEKVNGIIGPDLLRIGLERTRNCREAIELMTGLLEEYGQGGSAELKGNSHFDSSFLMADTTEAYILETAGRKWAVRRIESIGSISNMLGIGSKWDRCSVMTEKGELDWSATYALAEVPPTLGSPERQKITYDLLETHHGNITTKTMFDIMRHHHQGYHPAREEVHRNICMHAGPQDNRWWQADGVMVTSVGANGLIAWATGTSGNCVSIFKPLFSGLDIPDIGPTPTEHFDPQTLWWKHELLHRRAMADFNKIVPEIRKDFDALEENFLAEAANVIMGTLAEKQDFVNYCFRQSMQATEKWIACLRGRSDLSFEDPAYGAMWKKFNSEAGLSGLPE
jgi:secernin